MNKKYNNFCRKCRNQKYWDSLFTGRVRQLLSEKRDGKRITIRLTKTIEEKLTGNISGIVIKHLAYAVAKKMSVYDDEKLKERNESNEPPK